MCNNGAHLYLLGEKNILQYISDSKEGREWRILMKKEVR
jgi:hypothetical protein